MSESVLSVARFGLTALQNLGFAVLVGTLLSDGWLKRKPSAWQSSATSALAKTFRMAAVISLAASAFYFWIHCALMADTSLWEAWPAIQSMLRETEFGHAWAAAAVFMLVVVALSFDSWETQSLGLRIGLWLALAGTALARSHGGHPVDAGVFSPPVWVDWVHLLAISAWVGLVYVAAGIVMPRVSSAPPADRLNGADYVQAMSDMATYALVALFLTGAYNGWRGVGLPANLLDATYGKILLLKLAFVFTAAALGGHNRFFEMPKLLVSLRHPGVVDEMRASRRFISVLRVEAVVLTAVLVVAAVLVASALPGTE
jgi:putative copper resistance protein D